MQNQIIHVLFVCTGNICRSPLAQGILEYKALSYSKYKFIVDSVGTHIYHGGNKPDIRSIEIAQQHAINITEQRSRQIEPHDFELFDYILTMDNSNFTNLKAICPKQFQIKIKPLLSFDPSNTLPEIPDPYHQTDGFVTVFNMLNQAIDKFLATLEA